MSESSQAMNLGGPYWPAARLYWARLDATVIAAHGRVTREQLGYLLEPLLPEPLDDVHAVHVQLDRTTWLACAAPKAALHERLAAGALTLTPDAVPPYLGAAVDPRRLNLLTDEFEPAVLRHARRRTTMLAAGAALLALALAITGIERRRLHAEAHATALQAAADARIAAALGAEGPSALPPRLQLAARVRALAQTRTGASGGMAPDDRGDTLAALLRRWPAEVPARTESLLFAEKALHVTVRVPSADLGQRLATALADLPGFRAAFPAIEADAEGSFRLSLEWTRDAGGGP